MELLRESSVSMSGYVPVRLVSILVLMELLREFRPVVIGTLDTHRFNPCSNGITTRVPHGLAGGGRTVPVSILVLMELLRE